MRFSDHFIAFTFVGLVGPALAIGDAEMTFSPDQNSKTHIQVRDSEIRYRLSVGADVVNGNIPHEVEKASHITIDDYNFDDKEDFSVWHFDEGMGSYKIFRIFVFSAQGNKFEEIFPSCGDEFINLETNKKKKVLYCTVLQGNIPKRCTTRPRKLD